MRKNDWPTAIDEKCQLSASNRARKDELTTDRVMEASFCEERQNNWSGGSIRAGPGSWISFCRKSLPHTAASIRVREITLI